MTGGTNPVATWQLPINTTQNASTYKANLDAAAAVAQRVVDIFACRQTGTPAMTVTLDPGNIFDGTTLTEVASQVTGTITAPVGNPRIDRVVVDRFTGVLSVITGTAASSPVAPAITTGKVPVAQILIQTSSTVITNNMITDERNVSALGRGLLGELGITNSVTNAMLAQMSTLTIKSNITGVTANAADNSLTAILDAALGSTQGGILYRGASAWSFLSPGTAGQILTTHGASTNPTWGSGTAVVTVKEQKFTSGGTYTPSTGMLYALVRAMGGGGSGASTDGSTRQSGGGAAGAYAEAVFSAATIGSSQTITIGAGGTLVNSVSSSGNTGGTTSFGSLISCAGGTGGGTQVASATNTMAPGGVGGAASGGDINAQGMPGLPGISVNAGAGAGISGSGASTLFGAGGNGLALGSGPGNAGQGYGAGGGGIATASTNSGAGAPGVIYIIEYCSQ